MRKGRICDPNAMKPAPSVPINRETFIAPWPEVGLATMHSPHDPAPSIRIEDGRVVEMDGTPREAFDLIDHFIARHAIDLDVADRAMNTPSLEIARMLVDINVPRAEIVELVSGCTAAKLVDIVRQMNVLEMMMGLTKMRVRRTPANQAHVTNRKEHPALLAADAAEAALRGFAEIETTVGVARYAPLNALAILVGSQTGRGGVLTQCSVEEATNLRLGFRGLTTYSETLSVYGTERAFVDGDDTPWSKAFLAAAYASRGVKTRFTSGTGSEALMGHAEGKSMLYLEARCLLVTRGAGSQGTQNGSISCIALPESLPGGVRTVLAENLIATMLGLEVAAGNDALASHSEMRKSAKLMLQFIPGTDFVTSGYGAIPRYDNMFGGGNFDVTEMDDWYVLQRDMQVDGGITPVNEENVLKVRERAARAIQAVFDAFDFTAISEAEVEMAVTAYSSQDMPDRDRVADIKAAQHAARRPADGGRGHRRPARGRLSRRGGQHPRDAAPARHRRLFAARGHLWRGLSGPERAHRRQRLPGAGHRLSRRGQALAAAAGHPPGLGPARVRRAAGLHASALALAGRTRSCPTGHRARGRDRPRPGLWRADRRNTRRAGPPRGARGADRGHSGRGAARRA